jgi:hypothetical protein
VKIYIFAVIAWTAICANYGTVRNRCRSEVTHLRAENEELRTLLREQMERETEALFPLPRR